MNFADLLQTNMQNDTYVYTAEFESTSSDL